MQHEYHWIITYDVRDNRRLARVAKIMESYAFRIQKSVYEVKTTDYIIRNIQRRLLNVIDEQVDCVLFLPMCESDYQKSEKYGIFDKNEPENDLFKIL